MEAYFHSRGYAFVGVKPEIKRNPAQHTVDLMYEVGEGPRVWIESIGIINNTRTKDEVIRRELRFAERDAFNAGLIHKARQRLQDLDYFDEVEITPSPGSASDEAIVTVSVTEKVTGSLGASFHLGADGIPSVDLALKEPNYLGQGQSFIADIEFSRGGTKGEVSFAEPWLAGRNLPAKWGIKFDTGSSTELRTLFAGFQVTLWAGILVFPMPLVLLLLLQGAYYSHLWSDDSARSRRHFARTMAACRTTIILQISYFAMAQIPNFAFSRSHDIANFASHSVKDR